jgi:hypothetical protein
MAQGGGDADVPGPAKYATQLKVGSDKPAFSFGPGDTVIKQKGGQIVKKSKTMNRFPKDHSTSAQSPGPGNYDAAQSIGNQLLSTKPNSSGAQFGSSTREQSKHVFFGPGAPSVALDSDENPGFQYATGGNEAIVSNLNKDFQCTPTICTITHIHPLIYNSP